MVVKNSLELVTIHEITPRDGLQNLDQLIPAEKKMRLIDILAVAGASCIEGTVFVSPKWVPQMKDAWEVCEYACSLSWIRNSVLIPNMKGFDRSYERGAREMVAFFSFSETHNRRNVTKSVDELLEEMSG